MTTSRAIPLGGHFVTLLRRLAFWYHGWRGNPFARFGPYTVQEWRAQDALRILGGGLHCPDCGSAAAYAAKSAKRTDGSIRRYRACKSCGFWQEADGWSPAYRCWLAVHMCNTNFAVGRECCGCGNKKAAGTTCHSCARILVPNETFRCPECGVVVDDNYKIPWPITR